MANPAKFRGLSSISKEELLELKAAIDDEVASRKQKRASSISSSIDSYFEQILADGFSIMIETEEDEIELLPKHLEFLRITVGPVV